ncbi:hypothetical protein K7957_08180 [Sphingomonas yunnanensis]|uniref:hypothetical protein n=1 Tax=Sphingomonas TaxID=13687 RepID=UPI001CA76310|nr:MULTISPECIES: hypothetical protein [Sphingomonas]MBY9062906.1 hypothetical protein [Sphingomonas yunnanensis]
MTRYDPRAVVRSPEFDVPCCDEHRVPAHAGTQGHERDRRRSPEHGTAGIAPAYHDHGKGQRLLAQRAAARGRAIRAALAAVPLHRARLLRAMVAAHRRAA